tara:strand:+ start:665 stop:1063 length:399 start_codon:yes stop_codon:yes gene_type:complete
MPFTYCTECGYKNVFTTRQAKFCAGCGESLIEEVSSERSKPTARAPQSAHASFQKENEESNKGIPNIQKLDYTIESVQKKSTIGDLINTKKAGGERFQRSTNASAQASSMTVEELEAESIRECGSSRIRPVD